MLALAPYGGLAAPKCVTHAPLPSTSSGVKSGSPPHQWASPPTLLGDGSGFLSHVQGDLVFSLLPCLPCSSQKFSPQTITDQSTKDSLGIFSSCRTESSGWPSGPISPHGALEGWNLEHALTARNRVWNLLHSYPGLGGSPGAVTRDGQMSTHWPKPPILGLLEAFFGFVSLIIDLIF